MKLTKTFEELAEYRSKDGFIELDHIIADEGQREYRGNVERKKEWFDTPGGKVLVKSNAEEQENSHFSELICCELAKQAGLETAKYDIIKYKGEKGIVTKNICNEGEELLTINELIGNGPTDFEYPDSTDIYYVFHELRNKILKEGLSNYECDECMLDLRKQMLFDIFVMETDRHTENISFIQTKNKETGKTTMRLAPMYDTESALALYTDKEDMKKIYSNIFKVSEITNMQEPKICVIPEEETIADAQSTGSRFLDLLKLDVNSDSGYATKSEEIWKSTLDFLSEDRRASDFVEEKLTKMNISKAISQVEEQIGCKLPEEVRCMAINCFEDRSEAIKYELGLEFDIEETKNEKNKNEKKVDIR